MTNSPRGFDRGSCIVWSDEPATQPAAEPRPEVIALFQCILGDNIENEAVQQLIEGVVELMRQREK